MKKEELQNFINQGLSQRKISEKSGQSHTSIRYWLKKYSLKTKNKTPQNTTDYQNNQKYCSKCDKKKPLGDFYERFDSNAYSSYCKKCSNKLTINGQYNQCNCGKRKTKKSNHCQSCSNANQQKYETLEDILHYRSRYGQSAAFNIVRGRARSLLTHSKCQKCGYDKHVEACHIKPISSFPNNTLIDTINAPDNLLALCPNCHWEFDHNQQS